MWDLPFVIDSDLVEHLVQQGLYKRGYGNKKVSLQVPMHWIADLDVLSNFRLQLPFGLGGGEAGEQARYYYVESLTYNFTAGTINITGIDLQFLLQQCVMLGDCGSLPATWAEATEEQRMFGYLCACGSGDGGEFPSDGSPCKMLCPCAPAMDPCGRGG